MSWRCRLLLALVLYLASAVPNAAQATPGLPAGVYACLRPAHHPVTNRLTLLSTSYVIRLLSQDRYTLSDPELVGGSYMYVPGSREVYWHSGALRGVSTRYLVWGTQPPTLVLIRPWGRRADWYCIRRPA